MDAGTALCQNASSLAELKTFSTNFSILLAIDSSIAVATVIGNCLFVFAILKLKSMHIPSNILLCALCFSDLLVGFFVQPLYIAQLAMILAEDSARQNILDVMYTLFYICGGLSYFFTVLISIDRYIAICHPFWYHANATCKKHLIFTITSTMLWTSVFGLTGRLFKNAKIVLYTRITILTITTLPLFFSYAAIYRVLRKQRRHVFTIGKISTEERTQHNRRKKEWDKAKTVGIIVILFAVSYSPFTVLKSLAMIRGQFCLASASHYIANLWMNFGILTNSLLNPIVYILRSKDIKDFIYRKHRGTNFSRD